MDSDDDIESLLSLRDIGMGVHDAAPPSNVSDEELDALIYEALTGAEASETKRNTTTYITAKNAHQYREHGLRSQVSSETLPSGISVRPSSMTINEHAVLTNNNSGSSSDTDSELILQAVLAGNGLPELKNIQPHVSFRKTPKKTIRESAATLKYAKEKEGDDDNDNILRQNLTQYVSKKEWKDEEKKSQEFMTTPQGRGGGGAIHMTPTISATTGDKECDISTNNNDNHTELCGSDQNEKDSQQRVVSKGHVGNHICTSDNQNDGERRETSVSAKTASCIVHDLENEKQILNAILNAVHDRQSSVSGDLISEEDGYNVEAVLRHAEHVAASSFREKKGAKANRVMHLHEHIELREELRRARGSVGWPSCVCARAVTVVIEANSPKHLTLPPSTTKTTPLPSSSSGTSSSSLSLKRPNICIGTTLGVLVFFDAKRKICGMCGSVATASVESRGTVVSLSMSFDASTVISGHERGVIVLWDTDTLSALREIVGEFTTPVTCLRHCHTDPFRVILLHSSGSVKLISFTRIMSKTVYRMKNIAASLAETPFNDIDIAFLKEEEMYLLAAISADTLLIYALGFGLKSVATPLVRRTQPPKSARMHELVRFVSMSMGNQVFMCVAWGADVEIFSIAAGGLLTNLQRIANVRLEGPLHAMTPIVDCCLLLLDQNDSVHLLDASAGVIVETLALQGIEPVSFSSRSCGTRYNAALTCSGSDAILLGRRRAFTCTLLSWDARLDALVKQRRFFDALELAKAFALEVALAVVGLHGDSATRRAHIHSYLVHLVTAYLMDTINKQLSQGELARSITCIIHFCADIDGMDVFFSSAMDYLRNDPATYSLALYCLEECILSGAVTSLPEIYIQPFFDLFANGNLPVLSGSTYETETGDALRGVLRAERALMRLDNAQELLMRVAEKHNLLRLAVAILSYRQYRYVDALQVALERDKEGGVALSFFECTMKGYTVLEDVELPEHQRRTAKEQLWNHLLTVTDDFTALLRIDPERTLRATLLSLEENGPDSPWHSMSLKMCCVTQLFVQLTGSDLLSNAVFHPWELSRREWPPYTVIHQLFTGLVHLLPSGALAFNQLQLFCEHSCSHFIYQFQTSENETQRRRVQSDLATLFTSTVTKNVNFKFVEDELCHHQMARALAALHCSRWEYAEAIECYLEKENNRVDSNLSKDVFGVIREEMNRAQRLGEEEMAQRLREAVVHRIPLLLDVDATLLAKLVLEYLPGNQEDVINIFRNSGETFLRYLDELVTKGDSKMANDAKLQNTYIELLCAHDPARVYPYLYSHDSIVTYDLHIVLHAVRQHKIADALVFLLEKTLMFEEAVEVLVDVVAEKMSGVRDEVINHVVLASQKKPYPSLVSLPMISEEKQEFKVMGVMKMKKQEEEQQRDISHWAGEEPLEQVLKVGIDLCTKYHDEFNTQSGESWFRLLELFTHPRCLLCDRQNQHNAALQSALDTVDGFEDDELQAALEFVKTSSNGNSRFPLLSSPLSPRGVAFLEYMVSLYTKYVSYILTHMIQVLDLSCVVFRIVKDHERERFGPFKPVIVDIMSSLSFELEINHLCKISIDEDLIALGDKLHRSFNTGVVPLSDACYICEEGLGTVRGAEGEATVRIYTCGHGYHEVCAAKFEEDGECVQCRRERAGDMSPAVWKFRNGGTDDWNKGKNIYMSIVKGDKNGEQHKVEEEEEKNKEDLSRILRRLRHTRAKLDRGRSYRQLLCGFLGLNDASVPPLEILKESMGKSLLAPAPPFPINLGEFSVETLNLDANLTVTLTDEEVFELFGAQEVGEEGEELLSIGDGVEFQLDIVPTSDA